MVQSPGCTSLDGSDTESGAVQQNTSFDQYSNIISSYDSLSVHCTSKCPPVSHDLACTGKDLTNSFVTCRRNDQSSNEGKELCKNKFPSYTQLDTFHLFRTHTDKCCCKSQVATTSDVYRSFPAPEQTPLNTSCTLQYNGASGGLCTEQKQERSMGCGASMSMPASVVVSQLLPKRDQQRSSTPNRLRSSSESSCSDSSTGGGGESKSQDDASSGGDDGGDVALTKMSFSDLVHAQRSYESDVTPRLEDRYIRSHFARRHSSAGAGGSGSGGRCRLRRAHASSGNFDDKTSTTSVDTPTTTSSTTSSDESVVANQTRGRLRILHFNDVYEIDERPCEPVGGASKFASFMRRCAREAELADGERPLVVFSGDCLNPSTLSCATQGRHMIEVLNNLEVDVAVFGNHEFDFGVKHVIDCVRLMHSRWLLANVVDNLTGENLAGGIRKMMITRRNGMKIGLVGLVEEEWLDTLATVDKKDLSYTDYVLKGREIALELRAEGAEMVIALTHMRWANDIRLAQEVTEIDMILGGHDHEYGLKEENERLIVKSGSDFRNFSDVDVVMRVDGCIDVSVRRHDVTTSVHDDPSMKQIVDKYVSTLERSLSKSIGTVLTDLDGRFETIRSRETALGNFVADIIAAVTQADVVLINSGTFRSDHTHAEGDFNLRDLMTMLPISDTVVVIRVTGRQLLQAIENGVGKVPRLEGRFPHVSRLCFGFDPDEQPGRRIVAKTVRVSGAPLDPDAEYRMATRAYLARGRDGYTCLRDCPLLTDPDSGALLSTIVRNHVMNVGKLLDFQRQHCCKVKVTWDGRSLMCDGDERDPYDAFKLARRDDLVEPHRAVQRDMKPVISDVTMTSSPPADERDDDVTSSRHVANFIAPSSFARWEPDGAAARGDDRSIADRVSELRRKSLDGAGSRNQRLMSERASSARDLRWQVLPLLEARIFHCRSF